MQYFPIGPRGSGEKSPPCSALLVVPCLLEGLLVLPSISVVQRTCIDPNTYVITSRILHTPSSYTKLTRLYLITGERNELLQQVRVWYVGANVRSSRDTSAVVPVAPHTGASDTHVATALLGRCALQA